MMCSQTSLGAQSPPAANQQYMENAAVKYLRADAALRQSYTLAPDAAAKHEKLLDLALDGADENLVPAAFEVFIQLHQRSTIKACDRAGSVRDGRLRYTASHGAI